MGYSKRTSRRVQFFQPGELPLVLLELVHGRPRHGYELMNELDRLFGPAYRASAGSVYPALTALVEEGLIVEEAGGARRRYRCSSTGRAALDKRRSALAAIEVRTGVRLRPEHELASVVERFGARVEQLRGLVEPDELEEMLSEVATRLETAANKGRKSHDRSS
jgi:DNA-binding PadR family transcriptional regulator